MVEDGGGAKRFQKGGRTKMGKGGSGQKMLKEEGKKKVERQHFNGENGLEEDALHHRNGQKLKRS